MPGFGSYRGYGQRQSTSPRLLQEQTMEHTQPYTQQPPLTITAERDPYIDSYMGKFDARAAQYDAFRDDIAEGTDQDAVNAMMRERDLTSGMAREAFEDRALQTGGATGLASRARTKVLTEGAASASRTNAAMAASGRQAQLQAMAGATGAVQGGANVAVAGNQALRQQQDFALNTWQTAREAAEADHRFIAARRSQDWQQLMDIYNSEVTG